jgi:FMN phosphatase YigB (HAD superfamily)
LFTGGVKIFPSYSKMNELFKIPEGEKTILVDDKPEVVDQAVSLGYKVIRVKRGKYAADETKLKPDFVVVSLAEIISKDILSQI